MANYWQRTTKQLINRYKHLTQKDDISETTKKAIETALTSKIQNKTDTICDKYCKNDKERKNYIDGIQKNLWEILSQEHHYLWEKLAEISNWRAIEFHYRQEIQKWRYTECLYDWNTPIQVVRENNTLLFANPSIKTSPAIQRWWSPKSVSLAYKKHRQTSTNTHGSKFNDDNQIEIIERCVFEEWYGYLDNKSPKNRIFLFSCFDESIGKVKNGEETTIVKVQIDREKWPKWHISKIHGYPISKKELQKDFSLGSEIILKNKISISK